MSWKKIRLGSFLNVRKGKFKPNDPAIADLKRVDKIDFSGKIHLSTKSSNTDMILIKKGDLLISGINVAKGAVTVYEGEEDVVATVHYSSYTYDAAQIDITFLKLFLQSPEFFDAIREQIPGGIKTEIKPKHLLPLEVVIPAELDEQREVATRFFAFQAKQNMVEAELNTQSDYLTQLRQALLREAMQGRLLPQNPTDEPAAVLLRQLQAAKAATGKAGKRKAGALFAEEAEPVEGPFAIPASWVWCPLRDVFKFIDYRGKTPVKSSKGVRLITAKNIRMGFIANDPVEFMSEGDYTKWMTRGFPQNGDLVFITEGHTMGFVAQIRLDFPFALAQRTITLQPFSYDYSNWFLYALQHEPFQKAIKQNATGSAAMGIQSAKLKELPIPLPPLAEQQRIVAKLEQLLAHCDALEQRIQESRWLAGQLLQTALREALAGPGGEKADSAAAEVVPAAPRRGRKAQGTAAATGDLFAAAG